MNGGENIGKAVDAMKGQPLALALIIINVMFLVGGLYAAKTLLANVAAVEAQRGQLINMLADKCFNHRPSP